MQALQQDLDLKEAEMEELLMQLAEVGGNQMRSEGEKAELRQQYEERIRQGEAKVRGAPERQGTPGVCCAPSPNFILCHRIQFRSLQLSNLCGRIVPGAAWCLAPLPRLISW